MIGGQQRDIAEHSCQRWKLAAGPFVADRERSCWLMSERLSFLRRLVAARLQKGFAHGRAAREEGSPVGLRTGAVWLASGLA